MSGVVELGPHERMSVEDCLSYSAREHAEYQDVIVVGVDQDGAVIFRSSGMTREFATFILLEAVDKARGISRT